MDDFIDAFAINEKEVSKNSLRPSPVIRRRNAIDMFLNQLTVLFL